MSTTVERGRFRGRKIGVLMGGLSEEREISLRTGNAVLKALMEAGYNAVGIDAGADLPERIRAERIEAAFIALHGRYGEDGCVQGLCEVMGVPYTGSGVRASAVAMDKAAAKELFLYHGISTPAFVLLGDGRPSRGVKGVEEKGKDRGSVPASLKTPLVVKPSCQGSTIGVTVVREKGALEGAIAEAAMHGPSVIVEKFIPGRELTVAVFDGRSFPVIEIRPREGFYDYGAKYTKGATEFIVPAKLPKAVHDRVVKEAKGAYGVLGCSGAARVDVMLDRRGRPYVLEVNTVPGLTELSLFPKAAAAAGISYAGLVEMMLDGAGLNK